MELLKLLFVCMVLFLIIWLVVGRKPAVWKSITCKIEMVSDRTIRWCLFLFILLSQGGMVFLRKLPISADEVYSMSGASFFAGYNWSSYMHLKKFYNFGYTMLMAPIYKLFSDPIAIYRAMLFYNVIVHGIIVVLAYHILSTKLKCSKSLSIGIALVSTCNALVLFFRGFIYNEIPLAFVVWMTLWLLLELAESKGKKRVILSGVLGGVTAYGYIIHSRCVIIFGTLAVLIVLFLMVYKKWLVQSVSFTVVFACCFYLEKMLMDYVQQHLYLKGLGVAMPNSVEHVVTGTWRYKSLTSLEGIKNLISSFFSLAGATTIETGGLLTIVTVVAIYYVIKTFSDYRKGKGNKEIFILFLFSFVSLWGMVAAIALTGASNGKVRFVAYTRYFMPFIGPFLMLGLILLKKYSSFHYKKIVIWSGILTAMVGAVYVFYAYPILNGKTMREITSYYFFMAFARYPSQVRFSKNVFAIALAVLVMFTLIMLELYRRKQIIALCMAAVIFSVSLTWSVENRQSSPASERRYAMSNATYELLQNEEELEDKKIYCLGDDTYKKAVLVTAYDEDIEYDSREMKRDDNSVLITNSVEDLQECNAAYIFKLDQNEWIGFWDEELRDGFEKEYIPYTGIE